MDDKQRPRKKSTCTWIWFRIVEDCGCPLLARHISNFKSEMRELGGHHPIWAQILVRQRIPTPLTPRQRSAIALHGTLVLMSNVYIHHSWPHSRERNVYRHRRARC